MQWWFLIKMPLLGAHFGSVENVGPEATQVENNFLNHFVCILSTPYYRI